MSNSRRTWVGQRRAGLVPLVVLIATVLLTGCGNATRGGGFQLGANALTGTQVWWSISHAHDLVSTSTTPVATFSFASTTGAVGHRAVIGALVVVRRGFVATEEGTTLFRAVEPGELGDIQATGTYNVPAGMGEGKYFFPTQDQAANFASLNPGRSYTLTSSPFPNSVLEGSYTGTVGGEGTIHFIPPEYFPHGPVDIGGPLP